MKLARDTWLTLQYEGGLVVRSPIGIVTLLFQPVAFLLFFTPFLKSVLHVSSYQAAFQIYVPSLLCITGLFGGLFGGWPAGGGHGHWRLYRPFAEWRIELDPGRRSSVAMAWRGLVGCGKLCGQ